MTVGAFAAKVNRYAARAPQRYRYGPNKVFISYIINMFGNWPPRAVREMLLEAQKQGLVQLSRADLVEAMDPDLVAESEIERGAATYHFVRI